MDSYATHFLFYHNILVLEVQIISEYFINEQIRDKEVRLIGVDGEQLGIMSAREALAKAEELELDLIQKVTEIKELRLSPNIDENDLNTKANQARKFLQHGDKVKVTLKFRGREMAHMNLGREILDSFAEKLEDVAVVEKAAKLEGRNMIMFLSEKK